MNPVAQLEESKRHILKTVNILADIDSQWEINLERTLETDDTSIESLAKAVISLA